MGRGQQDKETISARGQSARRPLSAAPVRELAEVSHIGTMDVADKGRHYSESYEGHGLSVSVDPDEWRRIAKLGGHQLWTLTSPRGRFLEAHDLGDLERERIADWGVAAGLARRVSAWTFGYFDDELDDEVRFVFADRAEAVREADGAARIERIEANAPTALLKERIGMDSSVDCFDHLLPCWVEDERPDLDGVWWEDGHGPYSAPRGVIVPSRLGRWHAVATSETAGRRRGPRRTWTDEKIEAELRAVITELGE